MKRYAVTFYDLIAYIVPGCLINMVLATYVLFFSGSDILIKELYGLNWFWQLMLGYVSGHLLQAISTMLFRFDCNTWWENNGWNEDLKKRIVQSLCKNMYCKNESLFVINDLAINYAEAILEAQNNMDRADIFRAIQGFFRAMTTMFIILAIAFALFGMTGTPLNAPSIGIKMLMSHTITIILSLSALICAIVSYRRFRQFVSYRLRTILLGFCTYENNSYNKTNSSQLRSDENGMSLTDDKLTG